MATADARGEQTIALDCPPGPPRPGDLIGAVIAGTLLPEREAFFRFMGHWIWDYNDVPKEAWDIITPTIAVRVLTLYVNGLIRYGSW